MQCFSEKRLDPSLGGSPLFIELAIPLHSGFLSSLGIPTMKLSAIKLCLGFNQAARLLHDVLIGHYLLVEAEVNVDVLTYNAYLHALASSGAWERAEPSQGDVVAPKSPSVRTFAIVQGRSYGPLVWGRISINLLQHSLGGPPTL